jgi:hypothetical protein
VPFRSQDTYSSEDSATGDDITTDHYRAPSDAHSSSKQGNIIDMSKYKIDGAYDAVSPDPKMPTAFCNTISSSIIVLYR